MADTVLIITHSNDEPAGMVVEAVKARGHDAVRFDTDRFPTELGLVLAQGTDRPPSYLFVEGDRRVELTTVKSVWYRRFYSARLPPELDERYVSYSKLEIRTLLSSLFAALPNARWIDPIDRVHRAHHKVPQLELAKQAGFTVPDTLATNDPAAARAFFEAHQGKVVTKMLNAISFTDDGSEQMVFTSKVNEQHLEELDGLRYCPAVFQELVDKEVELRVAVVGSKLFIASVDSKGGAGEVDWRRGGDLAYHFTPDTLPPDVVACVHRLMALYGLSYGSLDIIRRPDGKHVFLEVNSAGEWAWLQQMVGLPIHEALADELTRAV
ncbi:MAG: MvdD family ATP-grasp ribosomal peptide maturase [Deltaproteobacteria bacterium]|nr:MvdD family ATP-grasp ribosomal peptide maturase [Deltaproteobacteria bacterium]